MFSKQEIIKFILHLLFGHFVCFSWMVASGCVDEFKTCDLHFACTNRPLGLPLSNKNKLYSMETLLDF